MYTVLLILMARHRSLWLCDVELIRCGDLWVVSTVLDDSFFAIQTLELWLKNESYEQHEKWEGLNTSWAQIKSSTSISAVCAYVWCKGRAQKNQNTQSRTHFAFVCLSTLCRVEVGGVEWSGVESWVTSGGRRSKAQHHKKLAPSICGRFAKKSVRVIKYTTLLIRWNEKMRSFIPKLIIPHVRLFHSAVSKCQHISREPRIQQFHKSKHLLFDSKVFKKATMLHFSGSRLFFCRSRSLSTSSQKIDFDRSTLILFQVHSLSPSLVHIFTSTHIHI
jgi:hypothetical protein